MHEIILVNTKHYLHNQFDSMDIDYTVAALMFPAIPLMMTMYSNRFHTLSALIRQLHDKYTFEKKVPPEWENQLHVLNKRTNYLKYVMGFASFGLRPVSRCMWHARIVILSGPVYTHDRFPWQSGQPVQLLPATH